MLLSLLAAHKEHIANINTTVFISILRLKMNRKKQETKEQNLISLINYRLNKESEEFTKIKEISQSKLDSTLYNEEFWKGIATISDYYKGDRNITVVLIGQKHAFYNTEKENSVIIDIQNNILDIQELLYNSGARVFGYEGSSFKEKSGAIATNIPIEKLTELYEKKCEIDFEQKYPDIYSYGIEDLQLHKKADSLYSFTYLIDNYYSSDSTIFPLSNQEFNKQIRKYVQDVFVENSNATLLLDTNRLIDTISDFMSKKDSIGIKEIKALQQKLAIDANETIINERNINFFEKAEALVNITREPLIVFKIGVNHFQTHPYYENIGLKLKSLQEILKENHISYVYIMPDSVQKYINVEFAE